jgi:hypothetical protein
LLPQSLSHLVTTSVPANSRSGVGLDAGFPRHMLTEAAPGLDAVEYVEFDLENKFAEPSIYRGPPTPARDKAWSELWECKSLPHIRRR